MEDLPLLLLIEDIILLAFLPNGTILFFRLSAAFGNSVSFNGGPFVPFLGNQFCTPGIMVSGSATANLGFRGTGQVETFATLTPGGTPDLIFSAGVGTTAIVSVSQDVTLTCPPDECEVEICANFSGTGRYRVTLPNGTTLFYTFNSFGYTVSVNNGPPSPFIFGNQVCATISIPIGSSVTANLAFRGTGSVTTTADWDNSPPCVIFSESNTSTSSDITLSCAPVC